ncbi:hypothetical protein P0O24_08695 [Methanotrichaceae archaeon M04Ac]|uniref:Uncharacterized protein n=1 Tax=Candidatus Methanocrinis alkalitolerans TaxID=3033395 RepID=A0ABT5XG13_9EURY|nr:hypothetical protein [Candidatus Methanocrinis alkalitolerans]
MVGGLFTTKLGEESLKSFAKEAFVRDNLPYIMGIISLLVMILAAAASSASAAGTITFQTTGPGMAYTSFAWSDIPAPGPEGFYYYHGSSLDGFWLEEPMAGRGLWMASHRGPDRYSRSWYNQPPVATDLRPDNPSPLVAGSSVTWTARATDPDGDPILYKFWLNGPSTGWTWQDMTGWTASNRWTWMTSLSDAGTSQISVSVKDGRHAGPDGSKSSLIKEYTITMPRSNSPPTATSLMPNRESPQVVGSSVTWTATATDPDGDLIYYRFWLKGPSTGNAWKDMTGWTAKDSWTWQTTGSDVGTSSVNVWIRDGKHAGTDGWDSYQVREFTVAVPRTNSPPTATSLTPNRESPQSAGSSVTWTATATDPDGDLIYYRFWLKGPSTGNAWKDMTGWTANDRWTWQTTGSDVGTSSVNVWIRDGKHAGTDGWDSYQVREFVVIGSAPTTNQPPVAFSLSPNREGPRKAGTNVVWTAGAHDPDGDLIYYRFWLKGPSTGNAWRDMTGWTANDSWNWQTTASDVGDNQVNVWIRDGKHAGTDGWDSYQVRYYSITW